MLTFLGQRACPLRRCAPALPKGEPLRRGWTKANDMEITQRDIRHEIPHHSGRNGQHRTGEFAAACSNAGALGLIGAGGMNAETLRENIRRCKELTDKPFGVNIMLMQPPGPTSLPKSSWKRASRSSPPAQAIPRQVHAPCGRKPVSRSSLWWQRPFWLSTLPLWAWMPSSPKALRAAVMWAR